MFPDEFIHFSTESTISEFVFDLIREASSTFLFGILFVLYTIHIHIKYVLFVSSYICIYLIADDKKMPALTKPAPYFGGTAVVDGQFVEINLSQYRGKYLVLFFYPLDL